MEDLGPIYKLIQDDLNNMVRRLAEYSMASNGNHDASTRMLAMENERSTIEVAKLTESNGNHNASSQMPAMENEHIPTEIAKLNSSNSDAAPRKLSSSNSDAAPTKPNCLNSDGVPSKLNSLNSDATPTKPPKAKMTRGMTNIWNDWTQKASKADLEERPARLPSRKTMIFPDAQAMKDELRANLSKKEYSVSCCYNESGWARNVAMSKAFENLTFAIIALNVIWIGIDTDQNTESNPLNAKALFIVMDNLFCFFFVFEILVRYLAFKRKRDCLYDVSFLFDSFLVIMMVLETWVLLICVATFLGGTSSTIDLDIVRMFRLVRITRIARMGRLLRALPELLVLIKGITVAARSVCFTLVLLLLFTYVFAVCQRQLMDYIEMDEKLKTDKFNSVWGTMWTLVMDGVLPDHAGIIQDLNEQSIFFTILSILFVLLAGVTVMNMLVGVLVEALLMQPAAAKIIQEIGVDVVGLVDLTDYIYRDTEELTFAEFMEVIYTMRGTNGVTVKDIVDLRKYTAKMFESMMASLKSELREMSRLPASLPDMPSDTKPPAPEFFNAPGMVAASPPPPPGSEIMKLP